MSHHSKWSLAIILNDLYCSFSLYSTSLHSAEIPNYLDFSSRFRIEAKSNLWKLASKRKINRSWRHDGKYHLVLVWYIFTDLVFFSLFIVKARRWLAQINATVPSPRPPPSPSHRSSEGMMARRSNCVIYETLFSTTIIPTTINKDLLVHDVSSARLKRHVFVVAKRDRGSFCSWPWQLRLITRTIKCDDVQFHASESYARMQ